MSAGLPKTGSLMGRLDRAARSALEESGRRREFAAGTRILDINDVNTSLYVVLNGRVEVRLGQNVPMRSVGTLGSGDFFGEMSLFEPGLTSAEVSAVEPTEVLELPLRSLEDLEQSSPSAAAATYGAIVRESARRIRAMDRELTDSLYWLLI